MKLIKYLRDKIVYILLGFATTIVVYILLVLFNSNIILTTFIITTLILSYLVPLTYEYIKKVNFYNSFKKNLENLD